MSFLGELQNTVQAMVQSGKGLLTADESFPNIKKCSAAIEVASNEEKRH